jgi:hypothetical protein
MCTGCPFIVNLDYFRLGVVRPEPSFRPHQRRDYALKAYDSHGLGFQFRERGSAMTMCQIAAGVTLALSCLSVESQSIATLMGVPEHHCSVAQSTEDGKTFACMVWDNDPQKFSSPLQLEIYSDQQLVVTIKSGNPIRDWHFWKNGQQLSVHAGRQGGVGTYRLYDTTTGKQIDQVNSASIPSELPQWAKDRAELDDESVPEGAAYSAPSCCSIVAQALRDYGHLKGGIKRSEVEKKFNSVVACRVEMRPTTYTKSAISFRST